MSAKSRLVPNRRCKTAAAYRPRRSTCDTYYTNYIRQTGGKNFEPSTVQNAVMVLGIHRSKSEVDINSVISNDSATSMKRSQTHLFVSTKVGEHIKPEMFSLPREEARLATTTLPKKGLIKLTALEDELEGTFNFGIHNGRDDTSDMEEIERQRRRHSASQGKHKMLFRRKNIQDQIIAGNQLLEEEERQKEEQVDMDKALEEYTMGELSQNLTQFIGSSKKKTGSSVATVRSKGKVYEQVEEPKQQRTITLPAINTLNINVFGS
ncbi:hypothetical protein KP79_PYT20241 [Mizuhopecten yessoensis]|uniref:Uncharacterized protein n=1 Tax=Mizuhopecten yessoensis TaxID=6573 RepID=A0A210PWP9_MIZYE|nr:hypothetical protein KP79_PYT20241 [Mizuhopecten yessoensis]